MYLGSKRSRGSIDPTGAGNSNSGLKDMGADRYYTIVADLNRVATELPHFAKSEIFGTTLNIEGGAGNARTTSASRPTSLIV